MELETARELALKEDVARLRSVLTWIVSQEHLFFAECSQAEEIIRRCKEALGTQT